MQDLTRSAGRMAQILMDEPALMERLKNDIDPRPVLEEAAKRAEALSWAGDRILYRIAVIVLGLLTLIAALGSIVLVAFGKTTPEVLVALGSAAVGALVGLFAPSPSGK